MTQKVKAFSVSENVLFLSVK